jgi:hypothetical protein
MTLIPYTIYETTYSPYDDDDGGYDYEIHEAESGNATFRELVNILRDYSHPSEGPTIPAAYGRLSVRTDEEQCFRTGTYTDRSIHLDEPDCPRLARYWCKAVRTALFR